MKIKGQVALGVAIIASMGIAYAIGPAIIWTEIKPILGPLIQALVVLAVGIFTIKFQLRQANTAERKLFTDIHDKRYKALTSFTTDVTDTVAAALLTDDAVTPPTGALEMLRRTRELQARMQELEWLFGPDLIAELRRFYGHADGVLSKVELLRHNLMPDEDDLVLIGQLNDNHAGMYSALLAVNEEARQYLYVGNITVKPLTKEKGGLTLKRSVLN